MTERIASALSQWYANLLINQEEEVCNVINEDHWAIFFFEDESGSDVTSERYVPMLEKFYLPPEVRRNCWRWMEGRSISGFFFFMRIHVFFFSKMKKWKVLRISALKHKKVTNGLGIHGILVWHFPARLYNVSYIRKYAWYGTWYTCKETIIMNTTYLHRWNCRQETKDFNKLLAIFFTIAVSSKLQNCPKNFRIDKMFWKCLKSRKIRFDFFFF